MVNYIKLLRQQNESIDLLRIVRYLTLFSFFLFFLITFLKIDVHSSDFWWHLATGKYIAETKTLPQDDPFSYTAHDAPSERKPIILKGYWLAQVLFYKIFVLWDLEGTIILRSLLLIMFLFFIFLTIKKQNVSDLIALILTAGVFLVARTFAEERPQLFTFLVFSMVFYLLEEFRINRSKKVYLIPILVMILANMHAGYIVCIMLITLYLAGEIGRHFFDRACNDSIFKGILMIWVLTIFSSMLNSNGAAMLTYMFSFQGSKAMQGIIEFMPTFYLYKNKMIPLDYSYIAFLFFSLLSLKYVRKIGLTHMLLLIVFTYMSVSSLRYMIFYMCVSAPILARIIINLRDERVFGKVVAFLKRGEAFLCMTACIIGIFLVFNAIPSFATYGYKAETRYSVPEGAANFLSNQDIKGNMFNEYGFGGYLIWRLYPDKKVFIDGRLLEPDVFMEYQNVINANKNKPQTWDEIINKYNISYVVLPPLFNHGRIYGLVEQLFISKDWVLIYSDHLSLIFLRKSSDNAPVIERFTLDKEKGLNTIIIQASALAMSFRGNPYYLISIGKAFLMMGKRDDAEKAFKRAYKIAPDNAELRFWMQKFKK